jgi:hypothetical protein
MARDFWNRVVEPLSYSKQYFPAYLTKELVPGQFFGVLMTVSCCDRKIKYVTIYVYSSTDEVLTYLVGVLDEPFSDGSSPKRVD